ncbi:MAG: GNAT family N-acetyltransferase [Colwellia sp.]|nr:GNAT family N-acetyltransferase [Colwellia sp.]
MTNKFNYQPLTEQDFSKVIELGNYVHGEGYLTPENLKQWYLQGIINEINAGLVVYDNDKLIGFRITYAINQWHIDQWYSPALWKVAKDKVCYFKCNTVDENYRGHGVGSKLLQLSIAAAKKQGALAGVSHLWKQSPGNSAVGYFTKCGGELVASHPDKWYQASKEGYDCILCGNNCHCEAAEMIIYFTED